jgi:hypothetical protein
MAVLIEFSSQKYIVDYLYKVVTNDIPKSDILGHLVAAQFNI